MGLFEAVIRALIFICLIALAYFLILWVFSSIGLAIPHQVATILLVILVLVAILILVRLFYPFFTGQNWFGNPPP
jgi:hypothetical protein